MCRVKQILDLNPVFLSLWIHRYGDVWSSEFYSTVSAMLVEIGWLHRVSGYDWVENLWFFLFLMSPFFFEKHQTHATFSFLFVVFFFFFSKIQGLLPCDVWVLRPALQQAGGGFPHRWIWDTPPTARSEVPSPEGRGWGRDTQYDDAESTTDILYTHYYIHL